MKKMKIIKFISIILIVFYIYSCTDADDKIYIPISPVTIDLTQVPLNKLSDYSFFSGNLKNQNPSLNVLPYQPASTAFNDYAKSKRFVWMPPNSIATYNGDDNVFDFPESTALIQTFYYDGVEPNNTTKIIETRLFIKKTNGWNAFVYIWNDDQTEAFLDTTNSGAIIPITWTENSTTKTVNYKVPSQTECITCHSINPNNTGTVTIPIGPKPQNINSFYNYSTGTQNQIVKWKAQGYLGNDIPANINSVVNWQDTNKSLELRAKSYIDINCAHCHRDGGSCDAAPQRFNFSNTNLQSYGICLSPNTPIANNPYIITSGDANHSIITYRMNSTNQSVMMPNIGKTLIHQEGVQVIRNWINSMTTTCN